MSVDMQQLQAIHHLQGEVSEADREVKTLVEDYEQQLADLPEQRAVDEAEQTLKEARDRLKITIASDPDLAKLADRIDEAKFHRRDLGEILSHHLVVYHDETGRDVIKDREATTRAIEFKAKLGKPTLDQPRLPLAGPNKYLGQHFSIPVGMKVEGEAGRGGVMERNVVSLETAKKLKAVGFPRVSMWHYSERMNPPDELFFTQSSGSTQFDIPAPTAQEIADRLPGFWSVMNSKVTSNYYAAYHGSGGDRVNGEADTLAEVLANLLLKLVENGELKLHEAHS